MYGPSDSEMRIAMGIFWIGIIGFTVVGATILAMIGWGVVSWWHAKPAAVVSCQCDCQCCESARLVSKNGEKDE